MNTGGGDGGGDDDGGGSGGSGDGGGRTWELVGTSGIRDASMREEARLLQ